MGADPSLPADGEVGLQPLRDAAWRLLGARRDAAVTVLRSAGFQRAGRLGNRVLAVFLSCYVFGLIT